MDSELVAAALSKLRKGEVPGGIAAVLDRETLLRGRDGRHWTFCVTDGAQFAPIDAELARTRGGGQARVIDPALLEAAIERRVANECRVESRLSDLVAKAPIVLRDDDLKPHRKLPGFF
jgi:hypothetical protein